MKAKVLCFVTKIRRKTMKKCFLLLLINLMAVGLFSTVAAAGNGNFVSSKIKRDNRRAAGMRFSAGIDTPGGPPLTVLLSISGEVLSLHGYPFPPSSPDDVAFVDGWEVVFSELLVTVDEVWAATNPDLDPEDQSRTGPRVAQVNGPWVIDLHKGGPLPGKGGGDEEAEPFETMMNQNLVAGNPPFDPTVRYAFGFDIVRASD